MSVDNKELLMLLGGSKKFKNMIGDAGQQGFGVGVYDGDKADLTAMGLSPMGGCDDPTSDNYGNYIHTNGSIMVFIPAFCYRIGNSKAPSYSRDTVNALEIRSATAFSKYKVGSAATGNMGNGWILHRAFIDSGVQKRGFFIDKYLCSKSASNSSIAVSVKNADPLQLTNLEDENNVTNGMPNCRGSLYDALTLSAARGSNYGCMTIFMFSALGMLSMAHGQAATSTTYCAWFDPSYTTNFPKGNNYSLKDIDDSTLTFTQSSTTIFDVSKTGSASNFAKCTHNGQNCGVYGVNGDLYQVTVGFVFNLGSSVYILKESSKFNVITKANYASSSSYYDTFSITTERVRGNWTYWDPSSPMFYSDVSGGGRALCGIYPKSSISTSKPSNKLFGGDGFKDYKDWYEETNGVMNYVLEVGGYCTNAASGVWCRCWGEHTWRYGNKFSGFRAAGYAE